jgi:DNA-binding GntR family transcriptional regulator
MERLHHGPTLIERAYDAILDAICSGQIASGERLNQDELAARLNISRQPVTQALSILKSQGFVRDNGRRGLLVAPLERERVRAIYQLREALDPLAARLAAVRCTAGDANVGRRLLAEGKQAGGDRDAIVADLAFHMWMYEVAGNPLLVDTMRLYWNHLRRPMGEPLGHGPAWDDQRRILTAIIAGDADAAAACALAHARDEAARIRG